MKIHITQPVHAEILALLSAHAEIVPEPFDADALMVFMPDSIDDAFLARCPKLKIIAAALKGYDNFDVRACSRRGIWFTVVPDLLTEATAELALGLMLALARNIIPGDRLIRSGDFPGWRPILYGSHVRGATVGIVGYGKVGQALAKMLAGFDCRVLVFEKQLPDSMPLADLLTQSDFVVPLLPLTPDTFRMFDATVLNSMKPGAFLVNVARGSVVDENAVADALESGRLGGYAADTFEMEDWARENHPDRIPERLLRSDKTVFTPHLGSAVRSVRLQIELAAAMNILRVFRGEKPLDAIQEPFSL